MCSEITKASLKNFSMSMDREIFCPCFASLHWILTLFPMELRSGNQKFYHGLDTVKRMPLNREFCRILTQRKLVIIMNDLQNQNVIKVKTITVLIYRYDKNSIQYL